MGSIVAWNCWGARKAAVGNYLRELVAEHDVSLVGLLETKVEDFQRRDVDRLIGVGWDFFHRPARGKSGGILVLWRRALVSFAVTQSSDQYVLGQLRLQDHQLRQVVFVYANKDYRLRRPMWEDLSLALDRSVPAVVGGDFNCITSQSDKKGGKRFVHSLAVQELLDFCVRADLQEVDFTGARFTWSNNKAGSSKIWVRLDRFLISSALLDTSPDVSVRHLLRLASDHCPILLRILTPSFSTSQRWIRFEDTWLTYPRAWRIVAEEWAKQDVGTASSVLDRKMRRTLRHLFFWSRNTFRDLGLRKASLEADLEQLQVQDCGPAGLSGVQELALRRTAMELQTTLARITGWWRQRAKVRWLTEGDANSHFFHSVANGRHNSGRIRSVELSGGGTSEDPAQILAAFEEFFSAKWRGTEVTLEGWPTFSPTDVLSAGDAELLCRPVTEEELWGAVCSSGSNRSPGLDGVTTSFIKHFWSTIRQEVTAAVQEFFQSGVMPPSWKETLVVLLPKVPHATRPDRYRPISLCQSVYKLVAKILVARLKPLLPPLIAPEQGAFVPARSISSHCLLAQEVFARFQHSTSTTGFMAVKVDMEQAYDRMSWVTLERVLQLFGVPDRFAQWVLQCVSHARFALLINGTRSRWIQASCGFRQGCPLSPYLFILCSELLSKALHAQHEGISLTRSGSRLSHLLYADDVLLFSEATMRDARGILTVLEQYCSWTGQKINLAKSCVVFSRRALAWRTSRITRFLGFRRAEELEYLGVTLAMRKLVRSDFGGLLLAVSSKLQAWGNRHLSLAGRATLIRSSLLPTPMYLLTHSEVPVGVFSEIERLARDFLWGSTPDRRTLHYVDWDSLCLPRAFGGLGFHATRRWMGPLRARLALDFVSRPTEFPYRYFVELHGEDLWDCPATRTDSPAWRVLRSGADSLRRVVRWTVGTGARISVLDSVWILDAPLGRWPTFVSSEVTEELRVEDLLVDGTWCVQTLQTFFGPALCELIQQVQLPSAEEDRVELVSRFSGRTTTALAYDASLDGGDRVELWLSRFRLHPREHFFWWRLQRDSLPTFAWLRRRRISESLQCPWGCHEAEDLDHVSARCAVLLAVCDSLRRWGVPVPRFTSLQEVLQGLQALPDSALAAGRAYCYAVYQCWRSRNAKVHSRSFATPTVMASTILSALTEMRSFPILEQWGTARSSGPSSPPFWYPPPPAWLKINIDGALSSSHAAGVGAVVRDEAGRLLLAAGRSYVHWDSSQVEFDAVLFLASLVQPWMFELAGVIIEGDCSPVMDFLRRTLDHRTWRTVSSREPQFAFLTDFRQVLFRYTRRSCNRAADFCSRFALETPGASFSWTDTDAHPELLTLVRDDLQFSLRRVDRTGETFYPP